jgi:hypothetical protein
LVTLLYTLPLLPLVGKRDDLKVVGTGRCMQTTGCQSVAVVILLSN